MTTPEVVDHLAQLSLTESDIKSLTDAIEITEGMIASNPPADMMELLEPLLSGLQSMIPPSTTDTRTATSTTPIFTAIQEGMSLARAVIHTFASTGDPDYLDDGITLVEGISAAVPLSHHHRPGILCNLGCYLSTRYNCFGAVSDLNAAIQVTEEAARAEGSNRLTTLNNLGGYLADRFDRLGDVEDLERAICLSREAIAETEVNDPDRPGQLNSLGNQLGRRFERFGDLEDLQNAISALEEAVAVTPPDPDRANMLNNLSGHILSRYDRLGDIRDLERAIVIVEESIEATPMGDPGRPMRLSNLGRYLATKFKRLGELQDLGKAILASEEAVAETPPDDKDRAVMLNNLSSYLSDRFEALGAPADLERAIKVSEEAITATAKDHPLRPTMLNNLSSCFYDRFQRLGIQRDLDQAIGASEEAVSGTPPGHPHRPTFINNLGNYLSTRFSRFGAQGDLDEAIRAIEESIATTPPDHPNRVRPLSSLSSMLNIRFQKLGVLEDINKSVQASEEAVAATPPEQPSRAMQLNNLSNSLHSRFDRLGNLEDLERAIQAIEDAVAVTPMEHPGRATKLSNLGSVFNTRYLRLRALDDLEKSIRVTEQALAATPPDHPFRLAILNNLSNQWVRRWSRLGVQDDLEKAIQLMEEAVAATPHDHLGRADMLSNLSNTIFTRYEMSGAMKDLEEAIKISTKAVKDTSADHPHRAGMLKNRGNLFYYRFLSRREEPESAGDLAEAIRMSEEAVDAIPSDHLNRADTLLFLAILLNYRTPQNTNSLDIALEAWNCQMSDPQTRIRAARFAAKHLATASRWEESSSLLGEAVGMLPRVSPQFLGRDDQQHMLSEFSQLAADACSVALQAGATASHCLSLLELGRGIIMGFSIDCRSDLTDLQTKNSALFDRFNGLRIEIDTPSAQRQSDFNHSISEDGSGKGDEDRSRRDDENRRRRRVQAILEMDETLALIRRQPGFGGFQRPPAARELVAMAAEGPIVVFNSTELRSDAIIVTKDLIKSLPLPTMVFSEVNKRMKALASLAQGKRSTFPARNREMEATLHWLWVVAVGPVFNELAVVDGSMPRIWWIGVGPLAMAPFHAAGDHALGSTDNTISKAISSYIPTIKALSYARERNLQLGSESRLLLITVATTPSTPVIPAIPGTAGSPAIPGAPAVPATATTPAIPGTQGTSAVYRSLGTPGTAAHRWKPLQNAIKEVEDIVDAVKGRSAVATRLDSPRASVVLEELPSYHAIHFACHGVSDGHNPSNSHLLLLGDTPLTPGKLTVGAISNMNIRTAQVAYLSACSTADNPSTDLADESIHIASGFQLAGFSHVLATLWESDDGACRQVAGVFYRELYQGLQEESGKEHRAVSMAFHHAVGKLREGIMRQPIKWAPFIHTGA